MPYAIESQLITTANFEPVDWDEVLLPLAGLFGGPPLPDLSILPKKARRINNAKTRDYSFVGSVACVSEAFKQAVEAVEPGVHQFSPIELQEKDGRPIDAPFYLFVNCQSAPCILRKYSKCDPPIFPRSGTDRYPRYRCWANDVVLSQPAVAGWHMWGSSIVRAESSVFISDEMYRSFKAHKLRAFTFRKATFRDEPWLAEENVPELVEWMAHHPEDAKKLERFFKKQS